MSYSTGKTLMSTNRHISTKQIFEDYEKRTTKLTLRKLDKTTVLIEGDRDALGFLGKLLVALAHSKEHSLQMSPKGAGKHRFSKKSTLGFYVHKLPCTASRVAHPLSQGQVSQVSKQTCRFLSKSS